MAVGVGTFHTPSPLDISPFGGPLLFWPLAFCQFLLWILYPFACSLEITQVLKIGHLYLFSLRDHLFPWIHFASFRMAVHDFQTQLRLGVSALPSHMCFVPSPNSTHVLPLQTWSSSFSQWMELLFTICPCQKFPPRSLISFYFSSQSVAASVVSKCPKYAHPSPSPLLSLPFLLASCLSETMESFLS